MKFEQTNHTTMIHKMTLALAALFLLAKINASEIEMFPNIDGWKLKTNERVYNSGDLWELIDGAADIFLSYNFEDLHIAQYTRKDQMIRVEIYRHKTTDDAYGIYTAERMPDYPPVQVGTLGYKSQGIVNFLSGPYYVKIMSAGIKEAEESIIAMIASGVARQMNQPDALPDVLALFPAEGKMILSDTYVAQNFLGYSFLHHAFSARYNQPSDFQLFIIKLSPAEIQQMIEQYTALMKEDKVSINNGLYIIQDLFNGTVYLKQQQNLLIGVANSKNEEVARTVIEKVVAKTL